jgi:hypothetical protein
VVVDVAAADWEVSEVPDFPPELEQADATATITTSASKTVRPQRSKLPSLSSGAGRLRRGP